MLRLLLIVLPLSVAISGCFDSRRREDGGTPPPPQDGAVGCALPQIDCSGVCVNLNSDPQNCGACGTACDTGMACVLAACIACTPSCEGAVCGDDGCGGSCGTCPSGFGCTGGECIPGCTPSCADRECGDDGCGGSCGTCSFDESCSFGSCVTECTASCDGRECGDDGCGGSCGTCSFDETCSTFGTCVADCTPSCSGVECGDDGCGGSCGTCFSDETCVAGICTPDTVPGGGESCTSATLVSSLGGTYSFSFTGRTANHTLSPSAFSCGSTTSQPDVAFRFTPTFSGTAIFETGGSIDTVMAVFDWSSCTSSDSVGCDDDGSASGANSYLSLSVTGGVTYYIVIAPYGSSTPTGTSTLTVTAP